MLPMKINLKPHLLVKGETAKISMRKSAFVFLQIRKIMPSRVTAGNDNVLSCIWC